MCHKELLIKRCNCESPGHLVQCPDKLNEGKCDAGDKIEEIPWKTVHVNLICQKHPDSSGNARDLDPLPSVYYNPQWDAYAGGVPATQQTATPSSGPATRGYDVSRRHPQRINEFPDKMRYYNPERSNRGAARYTGIPTQTAENRSLSTEAPVDMNRQQPFNPQNHYYTK